MSLITFVVGDWSRDGHKMYDKILVECNVTAEEVKKAYQLGTEKVGFDFCKDVAQNYEDGRIHLPELSKLRKVGFTLELDDEKTKEEAKITAEFYKKYGGSKHAKWEYWTGGLLDPKTFCEIYRFIIKLGNPVIIFSEVESQIIHLGGYGLFSKQ